MKTHSGVVSRINSFILECSHSPNEMEIRYAHTISKINDRFYHIFSTLDTGWLIGGHLTYNFPYPFSLLDPITFNGALELFSIVIEYFLTNNKFLNDLEFDCYYKIESTSNKTISLERLLFDYSMNGLDFHVKDVGMILAYEENKTVH